MDVFQLRETSDIAGKVWSLRPALHRHLPEPCIKCCTSSAHVDVLPLPRADFSDLHAFEARQAFVKNIASGEAGINLAEAALAIAAEDDALVSHSSVKLPVQAYAKRMQRMAEDIAHNRLDHFPSVGSDRDPTAVLEVHSFFY